MKSILANRFVGGAAWFGSLLFLASCVAPGTPEGVPAGIAFSVMAVHPNGYDIAAGGSMWTKEEVLRDAWQKKAVQVAAGRKFRASALTARVSEGVASGYLSRRRSVSGTITILDSNGHR